MNPIPAFESKVNRLEFKIAKLQAKPEKIARTRRIELFEQRLDKLMNNAPQDTFEITYKAPTAGRSSYWFEVAITDSPFDDTFTGGDDLLLRVQATRRFSRQSMTTTLANGDYWAGEDQQTLWVGSRNYDQFLEYETVTATLAIDTRDWSTPDSKMGDVLAVETFDMATLFA